MIRPTWEQRIERANELGEVYPFAAEILGFYVAVAQYQKTLFDYVGSAREKSKLPGVSFRQCLDLPLLLPKFPGFLTVVKQAAPPPLASLAEQIGAEGQARWEKLLANFWSHGEEHELPETESFFARAFLQPYAEYVAGRLPQPPHTGNQATCPVCDCEPVVAVLREEQLGAKRSFVCSFCATEWEFARLICPGCGEDRNDALCVYTSENIEHVRVDACDTCKTYIKAVDLTKNGLAVPIVDELATLPLTLWAQEHGYTKLQPNLMAA
ncbi:MAG: formate dehydrogenase accessory protein FdhE [Terriglobales bacterium]